MDQPTPPPGLGVAPPAGWYADPANGAMYRFWDGATWTAHTAPAVAPPAPAAPPTDWGPSNANHWLLPVGRSWQSLLAGYLGVAAIVFALLGYFGAVFGLVTIGFGVWALAVARRGGHGSGRAIFAIIGGLVGVIGGLASAGVF